MTQSRISLVTIFLPRMELDHIAAWIEHHRRTGIDHIYLYNNGHMAHDSVFQDGPAGKVWRKKPEANYHLDLSDAEVDRRIEIIVSAAGSFVSHIPWQGGPQGHGDYRTAQMAAVNGQLHKLQQMKHSEWLAYIDIDELIVSTTGTLPEFMDKVDDAISAVKLSQKLFASRWDGGKSLDYSEISQNYGIVNFNCKWIARVSKTIRWINAHEVAVTYGRQLEAPSDRLRFHHFRGNEHHGTPAPRGWAIHKYVQCLQSIEDDKSHAVIPADRAQHPDKPEFRSSRIVAEPIDSAYARGKEQDSEPKCLLNGAFSLPYARQRIAEQRWKLDSALVNAIGQLICRRFGCMQGVFPSVIDLGAGIGLYVEAFNKLACRTVAIGIDAIPDIEAASNGRVQYGDLTDPNLRMRYTQHDWSMCLEVAEHIPPLATDRLVENVASLARTGVIISWAPPGQRGIGHINCRTQGQIRILFAEHGLKESPKESAALRNGARIPWLQKNLMVFRRLASDNSSTLQ